jgi:hypothetical protein
MNFKVDIFRGNTPQSFAKQVTMRILLPTRNSLGPILLLLPQVAAP